MARRGNNEGSYYQRADKLWVGVVSVRHPVSGIQRRKYFDGKTKQEVRTAVAHFQRDRDLGRPLVITRQTLAQYMTWWLAESVKPTVRPKTYRIYESQTRVHIIPNLGHLKLTDLTPQHLQSFYNDLSRRGLAARTVSHVHAVLRRALRQAVAWELMTHNVTSHVRPPRGRRYEIVPLTLEQADRLLVTVQGHRLAALYTVALALGLRLGELLGLRWSDLDLTERTLAIKQAVQRIDGQLMFTEPKSESGRRVIALPELVLTALLEHRERQVVERRLAGSRWRDFNLIFPSSIGTPHEPRNVQHHFQDLRVQLGFTGVRFHDLRHTCATWLIAKGVHARIVMEILGHSQISLTMNTYGHVAIEAQREAAAQMNTVLQALGSERRAAEATMPDSQSGG